MEKEGDHSRETEESKDQSLWVLKRSLDSIPATMRSYQKIVRKREKCFGCHCRTMSMAALLWADSREKVGDKETGRGLLKLFGGWG